MFWKTCKKDLKPLKTLIQTNKTLEKAQYDIRGKHYEC
jgi:hypothetical protein